MEEKYLFKEEKVSSGISDLDIIMEGGFDKSSSIAILGPVGFEKTLFGLHFMSTKETKNYYLAFDMSPKEIKEKAKEHSISLNVEKFFDGYSKQAGIRINENDVIIEGPTALNDISLELSKILQRIQPWQTPKFFFHSFSTLLLYNPIDSMMKFLQVIEGRIKEKKGVIMILLEKGLHDESDLNLILRSCDYVFNIEKDGDWMIKSSFLPFPISFTITGNGITIL